MRIIDAIRLAARAARVTEVPLDLSLEDREAMQRGDLPLERVREIAGEPVTYIVAHAEYLRANS